MPPDTQNQRPPLAVPIILIAIGAIFLYANYRPGFDPWLILKTYWPLILIFVGLGKMIDSMRARQNPGAPAGSLRAGDSGDADARAQDRKQDAGAAA